MIDKEMLGMICCPERQTSLRPADDELLARLNRAIAAATVRNRAGKLVSRPLEDGLVCEDSGMLYPLVDGIAVLLVDEAIPLDSEA